MRYVFDGYILDTQRHELSCRGEAIKLRPKVIEVLEYLIRHRDRVVPKSASILSGDSTWVTRSIGCVATCCACASWQMPSYLAVPGMACRSAGSPAWFCRDRPWCRPGLAALSEAFGTQHDECTYAAELLRLRGGAFADPGWQVSPGKRGEVHAAGRRGVVPEGFRHGARQAGGNAGAP